MPETLYAHVHIPKTAGTTLIHLLRRNFFPRCMDVRPFSPASEGIFRARDLRVSLRINPALQCISGHSVRACSDLESVTPSIRYFTIFRDPVKRFISAFLYLTDVMKQELTFEKHLEAEGKWNLQTRWIAGIADLDAAKASLDRDFCTVGRMEQLNEFIVLLARELRVHEFDPVYRSQNIAMNRGQDKVSRAFALTERYAVEIRARNQLDIELMDYVDNVIMPRQRQAYGPTLATDVLALENAASKSPPSLVYPFLDFAIRKFYYDPVIGAIRLKNGLQYHGSF